jgi:methionyl-tRNA formyltransferase
MTEKDLRIIFLGRQSGQIVKQKLQKAGFAFADPKSSQADLIVVGFYGEILSKKMLAIPKYGALNVHPSLLPKYRGPSPVQNVILNNETKTGVTIILMDEKVDHGPMIAVENFEIGGKKFTTPELTKELWELGGDLLVKTIPKWIAGEIKPIPQNHENATYTKILTKEDGHIDWAKSAEEIERQVRAFSPWPGSFTIWGNRQIKILTGQILNSTDKEYSAGQVLRYQKDQLAVKAGTDIFIIDRLQLAGKNEVTSKAFLNGHAEIVGATLH